MAEPYRDVYIPEELKFPQTGVCHQSKSRPYVIFNMVSSVDGRASLQCSSKTDRRVMAQLRSQVDGVVWGGGTIRTDPIALKLPPDLLPSKLPSGIVWTRSGHLPGGHPLFLHCPRLVFTMAKKRSLVELEARHLVHYVSSVEEMLFILWQTYHIKTLLVEGGATFNRLLLEQNIGEELFLTLASFLVGDQIDTILQSGLTKPLSLKLRSVKQVENDLYLRYKIIAAPWSPVAPDRSTPCPGMLRRVSAPPGNGKEPVVYPPCDWTKPLNPNE